MTLHAPAHGRQPEAAPPGLTFYLGFVFGESDTGNYPNPEDVFVPANQTTWLPVSGGGNSAEVRFISVMNAFTSNGGTNDPRVTGHVYANVANRHFEINLPDTGDYILDPMAGRYQYTGGGRTQVWDGTAGQSEVYPLTALQAMLADEFCDGQMDANRYSDVQWMARDVSTRGIPVTVTSRAGNDQGIRMRIGDTTFLQFPYVRLYKV